MKRPFGITLVALMLVWLGLGAFVFAMTAETVALDSDREATGLRVAGHPR